MGDLEADYRAAISLLSDARYLALATSDTEGNPWSSPLFFGLSQDLEFLFISARTSRHASNIRARPRVAWSIYWSEKRPEDTDGIMFGGSGRELSNGAECQPLADLLYDQRFPDPAERSQHPADLSQFEATGRCVYALTPAEVYKVDKNDPKGVSRVALDLDELQRRGFSRRSASA